MKQVDIKELIEETYPGFSEKYPKFIAGLIAGALEKIFHINEINNFLGNYADKKNFDFIDELFEYLDFSFSIKDKDRLKIPSEGKVIIVSNHPLGSLDGLSLLKIIGSIRKDVKIVTNNLLMNVENLSGLFLPYNLFTANIQKEKIKAIQTAVNNEEAIIIFPAAEVSRWTPGGIKDSRWRYGAVRLASELNAPILPVHVNARNSFLFYLLTTINSGLGLYLLPHEMFNKRSKSIGITIGNIIPSEAFKNRTIGFKTLNTLLRKHIYNLGSGRKEIFNTIRTIIHPVDKKVLVNELDNAQLLGITKNRMSLYIVEYPQGENIIKEISRLREITFRKVGEGTGAKSDVDKYDKYYKHLLLWDEKNLEIAGAYRIGKGGDILKEHGLKGLYSSSLYDISEEFETIVSQSIELGRSFIQQAYWKTNALDYLWQGIGAFLMKNKELKYMLGTVSISDAYSEKAKALIIYYYSKWFFDRRGLATAKSQFQYSPSFEDEAMELFSGESPEEDFKILKKELSNYGFSVPVLFRKYTGLCERPGARFIDFGVDKSFSTVDGLILLEIDRIKEEKKERYYSQKSFAEV